MSSKYRRGQQFETALGTLEVVNVERSCHGNSSHITVVNLSDKSERKFCTARLTKLINHAKKVAQ